MADSTIRTNTLPRASVAGREANTTARYAIYAMPAGAFGAAGAQWLGWDAQSGRRVDQPTFAGLPRPLSQLTRRPRRYGFHATIRSPMTLIPGASEADLFGALQDICSSAKPIELPPLTLSGESSFLAFRPTEDSNALNTLAATVVESLDSLRRPLTQQEITRRNPGALTIPQQIMLARFGYPHVLEEFRFHLTLTEQLVCDEFPAISMAVAQHFADRLPNPWRIEELCVAKENPDGFFHLRGRCPLGR